MPIAPNRTTVRTSPDVMTPLTEAIGPGLPTIPLTSSKPIIIAKTQNSPE